MLIVGFIHTGRTHNSITYQQSHTKEIMPPPITNKMNIISFLSVLLPVAFLPLVSAGADYYAILGVSKTASESEIKSAYRKLSREYHPDKCGQEKEEQDVCQSKFIEISQANEVLMDPEKRKTYDRGGEEALKESGQGEFNAEAMFRERFGREPTGKVHVRILQFPNGMQQ